MIAWELLWVVTEWLLVAEYTGHRWILAFKKLVTFRMNRCSATQCQHVSPADVGQMSCQDVQNKPVAVRSEIIQAPWSIYRRQRLFRGHAHEVIHSFSCSKTCQDGFQSDISLARVLAHTTQHWTPLAAHVTLLQCSATRRTIPRW